ncbi:MAG: dTDP-glucose 4,6-dehydratase [bacterium JZ-2024 1]
MEIGNYGHPDRYPHPGAGAISGIIQGGNNIKTTVVITGGCGFIGTNLVKFLLKGHPEVSVIVLDALTYAGNLENFSEEEREKFVFLYGDVRDAGAVRQALRRCDVVVHLAAETHIDRSIAQADAFLSTEIYGTYTLLTVMRELSEPPRLVFISTSEVYGSAQYVPMDERHPLKPQSPYAAAKLGAEALASAFCATYELPILILRPFNAYGPYQYPEKLIPLFITNALKGKPLPLYGTGENTRDWTYVEDLCEALVRAIFAPDDLFRGEVFNIGTGREFSARQVGESILKILGAPSSLIQPVADRPAHVRQLLCSSKKIQDVLGWQPKIPFEKGLEMTVQWYVAHPSWWEKILQKRIHWDPRKEFASYPWR